MHKRIGLFAGLTALLAMGSAHAQAVECPVSAISLGSRDVNMITGHVFEVWKANGISWAAAQACATRPDQGAPPAGATPLNGHLATITSSDEDAFVEQLRLTACLDRPEVWVGGEKVSGQWKWVNNEGPIETPTEILTGSYQNWLDYSPAGPGSSGPFQDEPNNNGGGENWLAIGLKGNRSGPITGTGNVIGWNDEGNLGNIGGFVVEYDYPLTLASGDCVARVDGTTTCDIIEGQTITFPPGIIQENSSLTFSSYLFRDPRVIAGVCSDRRPLTLFEDAAFNLTDADGNPILDGNGDPVSGKMVIPAYLCGSPNFVVVRMLAENITIPRGVVITESETSVIVPGNEYDCNSTIIAPESGQTQDVGVWQSLDGTEMWESKPMPTTIVTDPEFAGTAAELTTSCGSTLLKTRTKSNFVVGLHIDFGPFVAPGSEAEYNKFIELTQYKVALVRQSVVEARRIGQISRANGQAMLSLLDAVRNNLTANDPVGAAKKTGDFLKKVNTSTYSTSLTNPFNYNGDHLSRGENILFTLRHKVIPFKPVP